VSAMMSQFWGRGHWKTASFIKTTHLMWLPCIAWPIAYRVGLSGALPESHPYAGLGCPKPAPSCSGGMGVRRRLSAKHSLGSTSAGARDRGIEVAAGLGATCPFCVLRVALSCGMEIMDRELRQARYIASRLLLDCLRLIDE